MQYILKCLTSSSFSPSVRQKIKVLPHICLYLLLMMSFLFRSFSHVNMFKRVHRYIMNKNKNCSIPPVRTLCLTSYICKDTVDQKGDKGRNSILYILKLNLKTWITPKRRPVGPKGRYSVIFFLHLLLMQTKIVINKKRHF